MKKIYLALSDKDNIVIHTIIRKGSKKEDVGVIEKLHSSKEVTQILNTAFSLLVVSAELVSLDLLLQKTYVGYIIVLDAKGKNLNKNEKNLSVFESIEGIRGFLIREFFTCPSLINKKQLVENHESISTMLDGYPIVDSEEEEQNNTYEGEANLTKPLTLEGYPPATLMETASKEYFDEIGKSIRKQAFNNVAWEKNVTIGVWSPLPRMGVTSFIINFAIYLQKHYVRTAVMELPNKRKQLKTLLERYQSAPDRWNSVMETLNYGAAPEEVKWVYQGVQWCPLSENDHLFDWKGDELAAYFNSIKTYDFVLVDLQSEAFEPSLTIPSLEYLTELWIIVDDSYHQLLAWKKYINEIKTYHNLSIKLIFTNTYEFSRTGAIEEEMGFPIIATLPALSRDYAAIQYAQIPLIDQEAIYTKLVPEFEKLAVRVLGETFLPIPQKLTFWNQMKQKFSPSLDSL